MPSLNARIYAMFAHYRARDSRSCQEVQSNGA